MEITINLNGSLYAHGFNANNKIHASDMERVKSIIHKQIDEIDKIPEGDFILNHTYRTIGIFGDRGSGKTSFLISLLNECNNEIKDIKVLKIIDPTLIEHKKPIILCVISMINQLVEKQICDKELSKSNEIYDTRREWEKILKDIALGIHAIDEVGKGYEDSLWQDEEYVMNTGINKVNKANEFETNLRKMFKVALRILGKKAFVLAFDDIDVDIKQGWNVLETLRRYLSDSCIISIVSGNIKLYGMLVRNELCKNLTIKDFHSRKIMENELESQYMLKLLSPSNRINLLSLNEIIQNNTINIIKDDEDSSIELKAAYCNILSQQGITDSSSQKVFTDFFLSMSLRSQIHFLKDFLDTTDNPIPLDVFTARLYAANIDIKAIEMNAQSANIIILNYLRGTANLADCYLLLPTLTDKDINSNFTALTLITNKHFRKSPLAIFDFMLRIGYLRNIILPLENSQAITQLCKYASWNQIISLKNNIGLTMAYMEGKNIGNCKRLHIPLFGMEKTAKKSVENALDRVLKEAKTSDLTKLLAMFPFVQIQNASNNESSNFYSIFSLLAVIGEILKCDSRTEMTACINDLKQFRSYMRPLDESYYYSTEPETSKSLFGIEISPDAINILAARMTIWKKYYYKIVQPLPPYVIGRIMTRLYSSVINIEKETVGDNMNLMIAAFFNSCLIEEARIKISNQEQGKINNNNPRTNTDVFINNLNNLAQYHLWFSTWIISCPMLNCFLDQQTFTIIADRLKLNFKKHLPVNQGSSLFELLNNINCKRDATNTSANNKKPAFHGSKDKIQETLSTLRSNGITSQEIQNKILHPDIDNALNYIKKLGLFRIVYRNSIEAFKNNYTL